MIEPTTFTASASASASTAFNLAEWRNSPGSIYVKYVPNHIGKEELTFIFCAIGKVSRVDIVNSAPNKKTGSCYRMAFIHFEFWYRNQYSNGLRENLIAQFPNPVVFWSHYREFSMDSLTLMINTRPVPKTIYNVDQLSDMYHRLREEYTTTVAQLREELDEIKQLLKEATAKHQDASHIIDIAEEQMSFECARNERNRDPMIFHELP